MEDKSVDTDGLSKTVDVFEFSTLTDITIDSDVSDWYGFELGCDGHEELLY